MVHYLLSADVPLHVVVLQQIPKFLLRCYLVTYLEKDHEVIPVVD